MKLTDKEKIIEYIDKLLEKYPKNYYLLTVAEFIDSLQEEPVELKDVDFEKELEQWRHEHFSGKRDGHYSGEYLERSSQLDLARHFYNLRLNARKEE